MRFTELLDTLGYTPDEKLGISWRPVGGQFTSAVIPLEGAEEFVNALPAADIWFGVNPTSAPHGINVKRGDATQTTRLAALFADLDVKPGGCQTLEQAHAIIAVLAHLVGTEPAVIVNSGNGLQPYWPIDPDDGGPLNTPEQRGKAAALLRRWGRLVKLVAQNHGADADNVFDLPRVLRVPNTYNRKADPKPVTATVGNGGPVTVATIGELLDDQGIEKRDTDHEIVTAAAPAVSNPNQWGYADRPCRYAQHVIKGWATDDPTQRHPWLVAQATRVAAMHRKGCLTTQLHTEAIQAIEKRFTELCARASDPRPVKRFEIREAIDYGIRLAARMTEAHLDSEVGGHDHLQDWAATTKTALPSSVTPPPPAPPTPTSADPEAASPEELFFAQPDPDDPTSPAAPDPLPAAVQAALAPTPPLRLVRASTIADTVPEWAWEYNGRGRILKAAVTLFGGRPGAGKSTTARWFAAGWTNGTLDGCWLGQPVNVAYIATEEAWHHTVVPSLKAAGANTDRVFFVQRGDDPARIRSIADEAALTELFIANDVRAVFLDPLMSTIDGGADINRNNETRAYLDPWVRIAERIDGPVIGVCHMTKAPTGDVVASITGSSAFGELARCVFGFAIDRECEEGTRVMSQAKNSSGFEDLSLAYRIQSHPVTTSDGRVAEMARFVLLGPTDKTVRELLVAERSHGQRSGTDECAKWLKAYLGARGRTLREDVFAAAAELGFSAHMVRRAGFKVGVESERTREVPSRTYWNLLEAQPSGADQPAEGDE